MINGSSQPMPPFTLSSHKVNKVFHEFSKWKLLEDGTKNLPSGLGSRLAKNGAE
jgi:hypothetical protein